MSTDGGLRGLFRQRLRRGFQWTSIETAGTGLGIPDSEFCAEGGAQGWIEYKQTDGWAVTLSPEQSAWHQVRALRGGVSFIAVRRSHAGGPRRGPPVDQLWLARGADAALLRAGGLRAPVTLLGCWEGGPAQWDWDEVRQVLTTCPWARS